VPRKNSRITGPPDRRLENENIPSRFAAASEKSGARDPIPKVSVRFCILKSTLRYLREQNKSACNKRTIGGTGHARVARTPFANVAGVGARIGPRLSVNPFVTEPRCACDL
jgi:hypothetical protein